MFYADADKLLINFTTKICHEMGKVVHIISTNALRIETKFWSYMRGIAKENK